LSIAVQIPQFEGPLGLLLFLIKKEEMDIFDINIHLITSQYLNYIKKMKGFDLEVAGDFVAMAAMLIQIKSKMLLPQHGDGSEEEEVDDPRKALVSQLLEYQKFKEAAKNLYDRPLLGRDIFRRGKSEGFAVVDDGEIQVDEGGLFAMIGLYRSVLNRVNRAFHKVAKKTQSIASRILEIKDRLVVGRKVILQELVDSVDKAREQLLVTFLSCLELSKMGFVGVYQSEVYGDIYVTAKKTVEGNVVERVEEYDSADSAALGNWVAEEEIQALQEQQASLDLPVENSLESSDQPAVETLADSSSTAHLDFKESVEENPSLQDSEKSLSSIVSDMSFENTKSSFTGINQEIATDEDILLAEQELEREDEEQSLDQDLPLEENTLQDNKGELES